MGREKKAKLKCGLEVHQQLDTGKLFCRCPSLLREGEADFTFERKLRPVASELGEFDAAALEQFNRGYSYEYRAFNDCCCLVECDEEPPEQPDGEALETALQIALLCHSTVPSELVAMRKTVIDGSNTSGFQRTMLVAEGGFIEVKGKKIGVQTVVLEEDASRPVEKTADKIVYSLDRQGIPLIELATAPEIETPQEAKECAAKIGELMRRTCRAKRGLGSIRQDLNISIEGGARIELKGVQELELIDVFVEREMKRQSALLEIRGELEKRKVRGVKTKAVDISGEFKKTECKIIAAGTKQGKKAFALMLEGFSGILGRELQPGRRFGTELADYIKARHGIPGLFHSDELPKYGFSQGEVERVRGILGCRKNDAFVIVVAEKEKAGNAMETIAERCRMAIDGVPEETRNALEGGNSCYSRPLPGAARMYPETDLKTVPVGRKQLEELGKKLPLTVKEREELYKKWGLSGKLAGEMKLSNWACFFERMLEKGYNATTVAALLLDGFNKLERNGFQVSLVTEPELTELFEADKKEPLGKEKLIEAIQRLITKKRGGIFHQKVLSDSYKVGESSELTLKLHEPVIEIISDLSAKKASKEEMERVIHGIIERNEKLIREKGEYAAKALMGEAMKELRGKADGSMVAGILRREVKKIAKKD